MCFYEPVQLRLQVDEAIPAQAVAVFVVHICSLFLRDRDPETLTLRYVARFTGKTISATWAFMCFVIAHIQLFKGPTYVILKGRRKNEILLCVSWKASAGG
jgi:hypothetical protein